MNGTGTPTAWRGPDALLVDFARAVRDAGVPTSAAQTQLLLAAAASVGLRRTALFWAGRACLCRSPDDIRRYDRVFTRWFGAPDVTRFPPVLTDPTQARVDPGAEPAAPSADEGETYDLATVASDRERLRRSDIADVDARDRERLHRLIGGLRRPAPHRVSRRRRPDVRGSVHPRQTLRLQARAFGEPVRLVRRHRTRRPRRVTLLVDVSGSMTPYAETVLRVAHHWAGGLADLEVFTLGTRVTRVTAALQARDPEVALRRVFRAMPDWSGGTRLGETLTGFLRRWGPGPTVRGACVVVFSDGWERGDPTALRRGMQRLRLLADTVVWVSPHVARPGYRPVQQGIRAALPSVDAFLAGHSLATYADLAAEVDRRR